MKFIKHKKDLPIDPQRPYSCIYWIYNKVLHTDPNTQGYVGVSAQSCSTRYKRHQRASINNSKLTVHKAMRKYGDDIGYMVLFRASPEFCMLAEGMLRPTKNIAWNTVAGGVGRIANSVPRGRIRRKKNGPKAPMTAATKLKLSIANTGKKQSPETIEKRMSKLRGRKLNLSEETLKKKSEFMKTRPVKQETKDKISAAAKGRKHSEAVKQRMLLLKNQHDWLAANADESNWVLSEQIYLNFVENPTHGEDRVSKRFSKAPSNVRTILKKVRSGWNPFEDEAFQQWINSRTIPTL